MQSSGAAARLGPEAPLDAAVVDVATIKLAMVYSYTAQLDQSWLIYGFRLLSLNQRCVDVIVTAAENLSRTKVCGALGVSLPTRSTAACPKMG
jgi:hypothetical protein